MFCLHCVHVMWRDEKERAEQEELPACLNFTFRVRRAHAARCKQAIQSTEIITNQMLALPPKDLSCNQQLCKSLCWSVGQLGSQLLGPPKFPSLWRPHFSPEIGHKGQVSVKVCVHASWLKRRGGNGSGLSQTHA